MRKELNHYFPWLLCDLQSSWLPIDKIMRSSDIRCNGDGSLMATAADDTVSEFWQQWQELQDSLYRCCLKLMNFNATDAEDALSQAMLKAWEKVQKYAGKIDNLKAWLIQLTRNLCIDIIRQRSKGAAGVESLEWVGVTNNVDTTSAVDSPEKALDKAEKVELIEQAIASLPERLQDTFILHFYQQRSHTEIAEMQGITYDNVCKRISLARKQLKEMLSSYFHGIDEDNQQPEPVYKAIAQKDFSAVDQKETGVIAPLEGSAESNSKDAIVNPHPLEKTYEENQQKKEPHVVAIRSQCCSDKLESLSLSSPTSHTSHTPHTPHTLLKEAIAKRCCKQYAPIVLSGSWLRTIASLPERLRDTFILHFYQQRSHTEIAEMQGITYDNVCKRISLARKQLKEMLSSYFYGIDGDDQQPEPVYKAIAQKDCSYHIGIIAQNKNFSPSPRPHVSASVLTTGLPPEMISAVDEKETGVIAPLEDSAESKSKDAIINPHPPEKTDEENQQKKEPLVIAIRSQYCSDKLESLSLRSPTSHTPHTLMKLLNFPTHSVRFLNFIR